MADAASILAQANPAATTLTDAYTVPVGKIYAVVSTIFVANRAASTTIRISVAKAGAADDPKQYLVYDAEVDDNGILPITAGITLALGDVIRVYSDSGSVSFNVFGVEVS